TDTIVAGRKSDKRYAERAIRECVCRLPMNRLFRARQVSLIQSNEAYNVFCAAAYITTLKEHALKFCLKVDAELVRVRLLQFRAVGINSGIASELDRYVNRKCAHCRYIWKWILQRRGVV